MEIISKDLIGLKLGNFFSFWLGDNILGKTQLKS